jgi:hypothetical protein
MSGLGRLWRVIYGRMPGYWRVGRDENEGSSLEGKPFDLECRAG